MAGEADWSEYQRRMVSTADAQLDAQHAQLVATFMQTVQARENSRREEAATRRVEEATREVAGEVQAVGGDIRALEQTTSLGLQAVNSNLVSIASTIREENHVLYGALMQQMGVARAQKDLEEQMLEANQNPRRTQALECFRDGLRSLERDLLDEAVDDLQQAIDLRTQESKAHLVLGIARASMGDEGGAAEALHAALKYADPSDDGDGGHAGPIAASAALQLKALGDPEAPRAVANALELAPNCAQLHLANAELTGSKPSLEQAIRLDPSLALIAVTKGIEGASEVADEVHDDPDGPLQGMLSAIRAASAVGIPAVPPVDTPSAMITHPHWLESDAPRLKKRADSARARLDEVQDEAVEARSLARRAEAESTDADERLRSAEDAVAQIRDGQGTTTWVPWGPALKPGLALAATIAAAMAGGGAVVLAVLGAFFTFRWGRDWLYEIQISKTRRRRETYANEQSLSAAEEAASRARAEAESASDRLDRARSRVERSEGDLTEAKKQLDAANVIESGIDRARTGPRTEPLFI